MSQGIGAAARAAGVSVQTLRYYEQIGLVAPAGRNAGGQRRYDRAAMQRLAFIRHARELGFPIEAVRGLLALSDLPDASCAEAHDAVALRLAEVRSRIARLRALEGELARIAESCRRGRVGECRVIEALSDHALCSGAHGPSGPQPLNAR